MLIKQDSVELSIKADKVSALRSIKLDFPVV